MINNTLIALYKVWKNTVIVLCCLAHLLMSFVLSYKSKRSYKPRIVCKDEKWQNLMESLPIIAEEQQVPNKGLSSYTNTLFSFLERQKSVPELHYNREILLLSDGGSVALDWLISASVTANDPVVLITHGYLGDSQVDYIRKVAPTISKCGFRVVSMNQRSRGGVKLTSPKVYTPNDTSDLAETLKRIKQLFPKAQIVSLSFSISGSTAVSYLIQTGEDSLIDALICISSPLKSVETMENLRKSFLKRAASKYMADDLISFVRPNLDILRTYKFFESNPQALDYALEAQSMEQFQERFEIKFTEFTSLQDFWLSMDATSSKFDKIKRPVFTVNAEDDFCVPLNTIPLDIIRQNAFMCAILTKYGGHIGFMEKGPKPTYWFDRFLKQLLPKLQSEVLYKSNRNVSVNVIQ